MKRPLRRDVLRIRLTSGVEAGQPLRRIHVTLARMPPRRWQRRTYSTGIHTSGHALCDMPLNADQAPLDRAQRAMHGGGYVNMFT